MLTLGRFASFSITEARLLDDRQWDEWLTCYSPKWCSGCRHGAMTTS